MIAAGMKHRQNGPPANTLICTLNYYGATLTVCYFRGALITVTYQSILLHACKPEHDGMVTDQKTNSLLKKFYLLSSDNLLNTKYSR